MWREGCWKEPESGIWLAMPSAPWHQYACVGAERGMGPQEDMTADQTRGRSDPKIAVYVQ
jgi:hypothetical protein